ncbi:glutathione S-transferase family protein [Sphingosinicella microcystinivorans]|uniref:Glutathione S-transferase n=1 Tax=Sphingosinicella microcystinivorans TaxID=335406 RepID=A0AAD1D3Q9_SPHMI|nr:glutathione S-transferase family protein [Sphingosinicella microcystinivorans]RKS89024.1 glutathione S-transferase [Sphingosinicella microcystinivorans]BBE32779.1 glutathione S-transferase [Sphingosinicella microcystinivorans]
MKLWHCAGARSFRPLWCLEELGLDYDLRVMAFPPRFTEPDYLEINPFGTVPTFTDGDTLMTESTGICHYLAERYGPTSLAVQPDEPDYGRYLNWLYQSDATLTFPQTLVLRYGVFEPEERRLPQAVEDYTRWFFSRLKGAAKLLGDSDYIAAGRFTIADIGFAYALRLAEILKLGAFPENVAAYWARMQARDGYQRAIAKEAGAALFIS